MGADFLNQLPFFCDKPSKSIHESGVIIQMLFKNRTKKLTSEKLV